MTRKWTLRLIATGALALALGCRSHPAVPPCTTPLFPEDVVKLHTAEKPDLAAGPTAPPPGARPPAELAKSPDIPPIPAGDATPIIPPQNVAAGAEIDVPPVAKPILVDAPRPTAAGDGFVPAAPVPARPPEPEVRLPDAKPADAPPLPLKSGEKSGHGPDYRWVAGTLDRHMKGGYWTLRYADIGDDDPWGGKVRLVDDARLKGRRDGDVVYVEGDLLAPASAASSAASPPFRVTALTVIERAR